MLPGSTIRGSGVEDLRAYIDSRGETERQHIPIQSAHTDDLEFDYGAVQEPERTVGHFSATARIDSVGMIMTYFVAFHPDVRVIL
jgi:hypothetical protein